MPGTANWEKAAARYAAGWLKRKDVSGVLVCGSYVSGSPSKRSDIDVCVVLKEGAGWRARGLRRAGGFQFEYFANPPRRVRKYFREEFAAGENCTARMYASGRVFGDKDGALEELRAAAGAWLKKKFPRPSREFIEMAKYQLWDQAGTLEDAWESGSADLPHLYHGALALMFRLYSRFLGYGGVPRDKVLRVLRGGNGPDVFPDAGFASLYLKAAAGGNKAGMSAYRRLTRRLLAKMGGFAAAKWELKSRA